VGFSLHVLESWLRARIMKKRKIVPKKQSALDGKKTWQR
jgi:hypothetical protein